MKMILLLLLPTFCFSQQDTIWLTGVIKNSQTKEQLPESHFEIADTILTTDETGSYKIPTDHISYFFT